MENIDFDKAFEELKNRLHPDPKRYGINYFGHVFCENQQLPEHDDLKKLIKACQETLDHYKKSRVSRPMVKRINEKYNYLLKKQ